MRFVWSENGLCTRRTLSVGSTRKINRSEFGSDFVGGAENVHTKIAQRFYILICHNIYTLFSSEWQPGPTAAQTKKSMLTSYKEAAQLMLMKCETIAQKASSLASVSQIVLRAPNDGDTMKRARREHKFGP